MKTHTYFSGLKPVWVNLGSLAFLVLGVCGLTCAQTGPASLVLDKDIQGKILIIEKSTDEMVLELEKPFGKDIEVGLEKGNYKIIYIRDGKIRFFEISLSENTTVHLNEEELVTGQALPSLQEGPEIKSDKDTLLGEEIQTRLFGEIQTKSTRICGEFGLMAGVRAGLTLSGSFSIGLAGYGRVNTDYGLFEIDHGNGHPAYGGVFLAFALAQERLLHFRFTALAGSGDSWGRVFYIFEPGVEVVLNVSEILRLSMGLSYPLTDRENIGLEYPIFGLGIQFGK